MYRYYKSHLTGEYVVMFDNALIGAVEDSRYDNEQEAINRVREMNNSRCEVFDSDLAPAEFEPYLQSNAAMADLWSDLIC